MGGGIILNRRNESNRNREGIIEVITLNHDATLLCVILQDDRKIDMISVDKGCWFAII